MATAAPFVWGSGGARMTPEEIAAERKVAAALMRQGMDYSPVRHWSQGLARVAQAMMGGLDYRMANEAAKRNAEADQEIISSLLGGSSLATPATPSAAPSAGVPMASTSGKIYENDEPSPLDPPSGADKDMMVRTVLAEAANQSPEGQLAVANVIRNRAVSGQFGGDTVPGVIRKPNQFEPWNTAAGRSRMAAIDPNSPQYQQAAGLVELAYTGAADPTMGATHFYAPKTQAALGRPMPAWDNGTGVDIGDHRFFGGAGTPPVMAGAGPTEMSAQSRPAPAPAAPNQAALIRALTDPRASDATRRVATMLLQQQMQNNNVSTVDLGGSIGVMDKRGNIIREIPKVNSPTYGVIGEDQYGNKRYGWIDPASRVVTPGNVTPDAAQAATTQQAGQIPPPPPGADPKKWRETFTKEAAERAAVQPKREAQQKQIANVVVQDIDRAINTIDTATLPTTGAAGAMLSNIGGTAARDVRALIDTIKANAGFAELQKMRDNSPTGGALGQVSEREIAYLQATIGNLEQSQSAEQLKDNLRRVKNAYLDIIHGPGNGPRETLGFEQQQQGGPQVGHIEDGYRFKGGNPADPNSWERVQ